MSTREKVRYGKIQLTGVKKGTVDSDLLVLLEDDLGNAILATGTSIPADGLTGFARGCLFFRKSAGLIALILNAGTTESSSWSYVDFGSPIP